MNEELHTEIVDIIYLDVVILFTKSFAHNGSTQSAYSIQWKECVLDKEQFSQGHNSHFESDILQGVTCECRQIIIQLLTNMNAFNLKFIVVLQFTHFIVYIASVCLKVMKWVIVSSLEPLISAGVFVEADVCWEPLLVQRKTNLTQLPVANLSCILLPYTLNEMFYSLNNASCVILIPLTSILLQLFFFLRHLHLLHPIILFFCNWIEPTEYARMLNLYADILNKVMFERRRGE